MHKCTLCNPSQTLVSFSSTLNKWTKNCCFSWVSFQRSRLGMLSLFLLRFRHHPLVASIGDMPHLGHVWAVWVRADMHSIHTLCAPVTRSTQFSFHCSASLISKQSVTLIPLSKQYFITGKGREGATEWGGERARAGEMQTQCRATSKPSATEKSPGLHIIVPVPSFVYVTAWAMCSGWQGIWCKLSP